MNLQYEIPNLSVTTLRTRSHLNTYSLRGVASVEFLGTQPLALYVDDAPLGDAGHYKDHWIAAQSLEVFRGPQGSRFGKNSEAGVLRVVSRTPGSRWETEGSFDYSSFDTQEYQLLLLGPLLKDRLALSLGGRFLKSDGYIFNDFLGVPADTQEELGGRAALYWAPLDAWKIQLTLSGNQYREGQGFTPLAGDPRHVASDLTSRFHETDDAQIIRVSGDFGSTELTSVTARRGYDMNPFLFDPDFSPLSGNTGQLFRTEIQWSEELRLQSKENTGSMDWLAGLFYSTTKDDVDQINDFLLPPPIGSAHDQMIFRSTTDTYALFGQMGHSFNERLDVTLGTRLELDHREFNRTHQSTLGSRPSLDDEHNFYHAAPKLEVSYRTSPRVTWFASTGVGFRPGGFNAFIEPPENPRFASQRTWANELGLKTSWWQDRLHLRAALFHNEIWDYQLTEYQSVGGGFAVVNGKGGRTWGGELEAGLRCFENWEVTGFLGVTQADVSEVVDPFRLTTLRNIRPPFVADWNGGAAIQYRHPEGWYGRIAGSAIGETYSNLANAELLKQGAYGLLSARLGYLGKTWDLLVFGENLADARYYTRKIAEFNVGALGRPREFGVKIAFHY